MRALATRTIAAAAAICVEPERLADMGEDGAPCGLDVEPRELAADRPLGVDAAEHDMGVGQGRPVAAGAVADGPGHGARALGPDLQQAAAIDGGDRPAAGADGRDLDHRRADDEAEIDRRLRGERGLALGDQRNVERRAAEIGGDDILEARGLGDSRTPRSRRRPGRRARCAPEICARRRPTSRRRSTARYGSRRRSPAPRARPADG